jgi:DNA polymerase-3 subunit gamma/tau
VPVFTHAPDAPGAPAEPAAPRGAVNVDVLRQAWPSVMESIKAQRRVAAMIIGNASVASFDEGVLTLRFPRQGDVKGFQGGKYEDLLKQVLNTMFGINVSIRAVTGGGDAPSPGRRQGPGPGPASGGSSAQPPFGQPSSSGQPQAAPSQADYPPPAGPPPSAGPDDATAMAGPPAGSAANGAGGGTNSFGSNPVGGGDLPPLPPPPPPDDEDFDPDDEDMSASTTVNDLTGMALVQRELGAQIIAEYED